MESSRKEIDLNTLSEMTVYDKTGTAKTLGSFWDEQKTILVFVRHFG